MPTATISDTTWAGTSASLRETRLRVRPFCLPRLREGLVLAELALLAAAVMQGYYSGQNAGTFVITLCCVLFYHVNNIERSVANPNFRECCIDAAESFSTALAFAGLLFYWFPVLMPRLLAGVSAALAAALLPIVLRPIFRHFIEEKKLVDGILIAGTGDRASKLYRTLVNRTSPPGARRSASVVTFAESLAERGALVGISEFNEIIDRDHVKRVIVAEQDPQSRTALADALLAPKLQGVQVDDAVDFYEEITGKLWIDAVDSEWFVYSNGFAHSRSSIRLERVFDITVALLMIILTAPLLVLIAIAIRVDSPGPLLFRQSRVGLNGEAFLINKFRTMRVDAERETGPVWSTENDDRVTRVGRQLRKYRLDELLQAFNVLRGEMSIVGPRPERPCFVDQLSRELAFYNLRHYVKPGITGWAQVMYRYGSSVEDAYEKLQYDLYYVKHKSLPCNGWILLKTLKIVLFGRGR